MLVCGAKRFGQGDSGGGRGGGGGGGESNLCHHSFSTALKMKAHTHAATSSNSYETRMDSVEVLAVVVVEVLATTVVARLARW